MINAREFDSLFQTKRFQRKKVQFALYDLSEIISRSVAHEGITQPDLQHDLYVFLLGCIVKYQRNGKGKSAFGYFHLSGTRKAYEICEAALKKTNREPAAEISEAKSRPAIDRFALKAQKVKPDPKDLVKKLDSILRRINDQLAQAEPLSSAYEFGAAGASWLQQLRMETVGSYLPMQLPTSEYTRSEVRSKQPI